MNRNLLIVATLLCLTACGKGSVKDDKPASDLQALVVGVKANLPERKLPNGRIYCAELARTEDDKDDCTGDLEDNVYVREQDRKRTIRDVEAWAKDQALTRNPCSWFEKFFRVERCKGGAAED